jgi:hypothetical protein
VTFLQSMTDTELQAFQQIHAKLGELAQQHAWAAPNGGKTPPRSAA